MYVERAPVAEAKQLEQGDLVAGLRRPLLPTDQNVLKLKKPRNWGGAERAKPDEFKGDVELLRGVNRLEDVALALVVSNSCDNDAGDPIQFAPIRPYEFLPVNTTPAEQWREISEAATGTASPKLFYLPGSTKFNVRRSEAALADMFPVDQSYLSLCITQLGMRRICGLTPAALRHLQWHIAAMFSRDARDDHEWPSKDDLRLKSAWLEDELARSASSRYRQYKAEYEKLKVILGVAEAPTAQLPVPVVAQNAPSAGAKVTPDEPMVSAESEPEAIVASPNEGGEKKE